MKLKILIPLLSLSLTIPGLSSLGSGGYNPPPSPPVEKSPSISKGAPVVIDQERYELGKKIFTGKVELPESPISPEKVETQTQALEKVKEDLPETVAKKLDIPGLAGKLDEDQLNSLMYYLFTRFIQPIQ